MGWYAIRHVYKFGVKRNGENVFEERIVAIQAKTAKEAHLKARKEAKEYARLNKLTLYPHSYGYEQDGEKLIDLYELWSELFDSRETIAQFYSRRYRKGRHHPE